MNFSGNSFSDEDLKSLINTEISSSSDYNPAPKLETPHDFKEQGKLFEHPELDYHTERMRDVLEKDTSMSSFQGEESIRPLSSFSQRRDFEYSQNRETKTVNIKDLMCPKKIPFGDLFHRKGSSSNKEIIESDPWATILLGNSNKRIEEYPVSNLPEEVSIYYRDSSNNTKDHEEYLACLQLGNGLYKNYLANRPGLLWKQRTNSLISKFINFRSSNVISLHVIRKILENSGEIDYLKAMKEILKYNKCWVDKATLEESYTESIDSFIQCKAPDQYKNFKLYNSCDPKTLYSFTKDYKSMRRVPLTNIKFKSSSSTYSLHDDKYLIDLLYGEGTRQIVLLKKLLYEIDRLQMAIQIGWINSPSGIKSFNRLLDKVEIFINNNPNPLSVADLESLKSPVSTEKVVYNLNELNTLLNECFIIR